MFILLNQIPIGFFLEIAEAGNLDLEIVQNTSLM
jgi:hypothetical protein